MLDRKAKKRQSKCDDKVNGCDSDTRGSEGMVYHLLAKINTTPPKKIWKKFSCYMFIMFKNKSKTTTPLLSNRETGFSA